MPIGDDMDWIPFITEIFLKQDCSDWVLTPVFAEPALIEDIELVEGILEIAFPEELRSFLLATNGLRERMKTDKWEGDVGYVVWSIEQIEKENLFLRSYEDYRDVYMPFDHLLFVAPAGNGDLFGYSILNGKIRRTDIFAWNHEDDSRVWEAPSLQRFIEWWKLGKIKL